MTVVDASVWVSALRGSEAGHQASRRWLEEQPAGLTIPALAIAEVAGAVARATGSVDDARNAIRLLQKTPGLRVVSVNRAIAETAAQLAAQYRVRGADAVYIAVARVLALPLATLDREMQERASSVVAIIAP